MAPKSSVQTFKPTILMYRGDNFGYYIKKYYDISEKYISFTRILRLQTFNILSFICDYLIENSSKSYCPF